MNTSAAHPSVPTTAETGFERKNYLNADYGVLSWLLTRDHKRIAIMYLISISVMFFLGGLFAVDIAPKKVAGAAMGFIGVFSYLGAALQENISGSLIESGMQVVDGARIYDFGPAIAFWIGSSAVSMVLAATLWKVRLRE